MVPARAPSPPVVSRVTMPAPSPAAAPKQAGAAPATASGASIERDVAAVAARKASYLDGVRARIEARKRYPPVARGRRQTGRVEVGFTVMSGGEITGARVVASSPYSLLNDAALAAVAGIDRVPPIPSELGARELDVIVPLIFTTSN